MLLHPSEYWVNYVIKSYLLTGTETASLIALLACPYPEEKVFFHPRPYWGAKCRKPGHYTGSLPTPMFAWHLRSRGSGTRQARCHQQMGRRYVANISVGSVPAWASECLSILRFTWLYERGCSELLPIFFFFWTCVCSCFYLSHAREAGFYLLTCFGFSICLIV